MRKGLKWSAFGAATLLMANVAGVQVGAARADMDAFQRSQTVQAAIKWINFPYVIPWSDCTYYVSSALWDGGMKSTADWTPKTSDPSKVASSKLMNPGPSKIAANADMFKNYMVKTGRATIREVKWSDNTAGGAQLADVIAYDWDNGADGVVDHLAMVTSFTADGYPQVSQHSPTRLNRGWSYDPDAGKWIEYSHPGARVYLIHFV
ncbi:Putative amidase domain [Mycobacteroides abscessus subsp. abscessus]|nr:Putative amidase domain [Mycobacteroides abscessus subsp. abscessus]